MGRAIVHFRSDPLLPDIHDNVLEVEYDEHYIWIKMETGTVTYPREVVLKVTTERIEDDNESD